MGEDTVAESSDGTCTLHSLYVHPVKSCAGVAVDSARIVDTGLDLDREWMLVDGSGEFVSQRECPKLALVRPQLRGDELVLRAPGMIALHVALDRVESPCRVTVWDDRVDAWDMGALAAQWFGDFVGRPLRLVRFDPDRPRQAEARWTGGVDTPTAFVDGFPLLVVSAASIAELNRRLADAGHSAVDARRFRPNLVVDGIEAHDEDVVDRITFDTPEGPVVIRPVKPCVRCTIPDVDPDSAATGHAVGDALAAYRADPRMGGGITFGMNAIVVEGVGRTLAVGQAGRVSFGW